MSFDEKNFEHLAYLSRLELDKKEKEKIMSDFPRIVDFFSELQALNVKNEEPFLFEDQVNICREEVARVCNQEKYLSRAPARERQFFKVPRVLN